MYKIGIIVFLFLFLIKNSPSQNINLTVYKPQTSAELELLYPVLTAKFYQQNNQQLFWFNQDTGSLVLRQSLQLAIDSCKNTGLDKEKYHYNEIIASVENKYLPADSAIVINMDKIFTDATIALSKDIYQGKNISSWINYDEVSGKYTDADNDYLLAEIASANSGSALTQFILSLEPAEKEYALLKDELKVQLQKKAAAEVKQLTTSLNYFRWIHHFKFEQCIVVNIASATLRYYEKDSIKLSMKVIVGKPSTKTPRFAAYCNQVILYPYWNVPPSIALNELLPKFKRRPAAIDELNMQVVDGSGRVVNHYNLNWAAYSRNYFPYRLRQSTGCDNSLGVIKFNVTDPYSVYLHDTNNKTAFLSGYRYYSHGCIRVKEPIELGNLLLNNRLDTTFLKACFKEKNPEPVDLLTPVPVMVIYSPAEMDKAGKIKYYKDVYGLLK
jgi:murein L,D-transpeptidase YcbB/YkuD